MPACTHKKTCPLYPQFHSKGLLNFWISTYCDGKFETCARFKLSQTGTPVPIALLPNGDLLGGREGK